MYIICDILYIVKWNGIIEKLQNLNFFVCLFMALKLFQELKGDPIRQTSINSKHSIQTCRQLLLQSLKTRQEPRIF